MESLFEKFNQSLKGGTPAEKRLARYFLDHPGDISFETAATVADKLDLSPMTVGRFLRSMEIDAVQLRKANMLAAQGAAAAPHAPQPGFSEPASGFDGVRDQADALRAIQALAAQPVWRDLVDLLSRPSEIYMTSFGSTLPLASYFAGRLAEIRDGVRFVSGSDGTYLDLLGTRRDDCLLAVLDDRAGNGRLTRLCQVARDNGHKVLLISHAIGAEHAGPWDLALRVPGLPRTGNIDAVGLSALIELAVSGVGLTKGPFALERSSRVAELRRMFAAEA